MNKGRKAVGAREHSKSETVRCVNKFRVAYRELARQMALAGLIPDQNLLFHLTHHEVGEILNGSGRSPMLISK